MDSPSRKLIIEHGLIILNVDVTEELRRQRLVQSDCQKENNKILPGDQETLDHCTQVKIYDQTHDLFCCKVIELTTLPP